MADDGGGIVQGTLEVVAQLKHLLGHEREVASLA